MDRNHIIEVAPHYLAMLLLVYAVLIAITSAVGQLEVWTELVVVAVVVFAYRPIVMRLGVGPSVWEQQR